MGTVKTKRGETARRIFAVLKCNPDLTVAEIMGHLPDLTRSAVGCALHKMQKNGSVEVRGRKTVRDTGGPGPKTAPTYHVKYKSGTIIKPKPKPKVEAPKPQIDRAKEYEAAYREEFERHGETHRELRDALAMHEEALRLLLDTMVDLAETKHELAQAQRNWWDKFKGWFA